MKNRLLYPVGEGSACVFAARYLSNAGVPLVDHPTPEVTHLLLDIPSFGNDGLLRSGKPIEKILETIPQYITVIGGNLDHPALDGYRIADLLQDEAYLAYNAAITAECALQAAAPMLKTTFRDTPALVIGWGRIGKCLAALLKHAGCPVTVAVRNIRDMAMLSALGYTAIGLSEDMDLSKYRLLYNTAPAAVLDATQLDNLRNCIKIDLASRKGLIGEDVIWARGLPGIYAPESSGQLICRRILAMMKAGDI